MRSLALLRPVNRVGALLVGTTLLATACTPQSQDDGEGIDTDSSPSSAVDYPEGPFQREGTSGSNAPFHSTFRVDEVVNHPDRTVLNFTTIPTYDKLANGIYGGGLIGDLSTAPVDLRLIDPVGQRFYGPSVNDDVFVGSMFPDGVANGAEYHMQVHFPPLPEGTERVTVLSGGTQGAFTGIPVTADEADWEAGPQPTEELPYYGYIDEGEEIAVPVNGGTVPEQGTDLYSIVETTETVQENSTTEHRVDLDTDVLFAFDEAEIGDDATTVLDEVVARTRAKADPELPPITIAGHTDGVGEDDYNRTLSEERAQAVLDYLEADLGSAYEYVAEGHGAGEPLFQEGGNDDEEARARNRRVEISYNVLSSETETTTSEQETTQEGVGNAVAPPAPFLEERGEPIASATGATGQDIDYTLDVFSLRRDGAFVVAEVALTNDSHRDISGAFGTGFWETGNQGGNFSSFGLLDAGSDTVYRSLRIGERDSGGEGEEEYVEPLSFPYLLEPEQTNLIPLYFPAPPLDVETVSLQAGVFGILEDLPLG